MIENINYFSLIDAIHLLEAKIDPAHQILEGLQNIK